PPGNDPVARANYLKILTDGFTKTPDVRLEAQSIIPVLGFTGIPSAKGRPFSFGANIWIKAEAFGNSTLSPGLSEAISNSPALPGSFKEIVSIFSQIKYQ